MNDLFVFLVFIFAVLGQFLDARTTQVGLANPASGFVESNPLAAWIIKKLSISGLYALKMAVVPLLLVFFSIGPLPKSWGGVSYIDAYWSEIVWGALGVVLGVLNYLKLRKAKISVF